MATIRFYAKPGCVGNARQRRELERAGHRIDEYDLLAEAWRCDTLLPFLDQRPVASWFNPGAPAIKAGRLQPQLLDAEAALALLLADPLLIRRPLLVVGDTHLLGYDPAQLTALLGTPLGGSERCPRHHNPCERS